MAPDLLRWGDDLISEPADFTDDLFDDKLNGVSDSDDVRARTTPKDKFTSSIVADKSYLYDFKIIPPTLQVSAISIPQPKSYKFTESKKSEICLSCSRRKVHSQFHKRTIRQF